MAIQVSKIRAHCYLPPCYYPEIGDLWVLIILQCSCLCCLRLKFKTHIEQLGAIMRPHGLQLARLEWNPICPLADCHHHSFTHPQRCLPPDYQVGLQLWSPGLPLIKNKQTTHSKCANIFPIFWKEAQINTGFLFSHSSQPYTFLHFPFNSLEAIQLESYVAVCGRWALCSFSWYTCSGPLLTSSPRNQVIRAVKVQNQLYTDASENKTYIYSKE